MKTAFVKRLLAIRFFGCVGLTVLLSTVVKADPLTPPTRETAVFIGLCRDNTCGSLETLGSFDPSNPASVNETFTGSNYLLTAIGHPVSSFGVLHSSSELSFTASDPSLEADFISSAQFWDIMTINYLPFTGLPGYLDIDYTLHGTLAGTGEGHSGVLVRACTENCSRFYEFLGPA